MSAFDGTTGKVAPPFIADGPKMIVESDLENNPVSHGINLSPSPKKLHSNLVTKMSYHPPTLFPLGKHHSVAGDAATISSAPKPTIGNSEFEFAHVVAASKSSSLALDGTSPGGSGNVVEDVTKKPSGKDIDDLGPTSEHLDIAPAGASLVTDNPAPNPSTVAKLSGPKAGMFTASGRNQAGMSDIAPSPKTLDRTLTSTVTDLSTEPRGGTVAVDYEEALEADPAAESAIASVGSATLGTPTESTFAGTGLTDEVFKDAAYPSPSPKSLYSIFTSKTPSKSPTLTSLGKTRPTFTAPVTVATNLDHPTIATSDGPATMNPRVSDGTPSVGAKHSARPTIDALVSLATATPSVAAPDGNDGPTLQPNSETLLSTHTQPSTLGAELESNTVTPSAVSYTHLTLPTNREV